MGAGAALGGPDISSSVQSVITGSDRDADEATQDSSVDGPGTGHQHCSQATQKALERLNELKSDGRPVDKAIEAVQNCGMGSEDIGGEDLSSGDLPDNANPNASERSLNASQGIGNANPNASTGVSHANSHATQGSVNADSHEPDGP